MQTLLATPPKISTKACFFENKAVSLFQRLDSKDAMIWRNSCTHPSPWEIAKNKDRWNTNPKKRKTEMEKVAIPQQG
jgi:hypothetical protein